MTQMFPVPKTQTQHSFLSLQEPGVIAYQDRRTYVRV